MDKFEFFCKLGYSKHDISKVLEKLGQGALENDILQELIYRDSRGGVEGSRAQCSMPKLVARGCDNSEMVKPAPDPSKDAADPSSILRPIVIDGSNVAMSHGNKEVFSCQGIQLAVEWFQERGHKNIKVFVPLWRREPPRLDAPIRGQHILEELEKRTILVYTPSRKVNGKRVICYDDRYIVKVAFENDGIIVSNDNYRDLQSENAEWKWFIDQRLLMYSFVNDRFMPPDDPLGRHGPTLGSFLMKKLRAPEHKWQHCPYGKKCTYGSKCKFYHPERRNLLQLSVADELRAKTKANGKDTEQMPTDPSVTGAVSSCHSNHLGRAGGTAQSFTQDELQPAQWERSSNIYSTNKWTENTPQQRLDPHCTLQHNLKRHLELQSMEKKFSALRASNDTYVSGHRCSENVKKVTDDSCWCCNLGQLSHSQKGYFPLPSPNVECACLEICHFQKIPPPSYCLCSLQVPEGPQPHCNVGQRPAFDNQRNPSALTESLSSVHAKAQRQIVCSSASPSRDPLPPFVHTERRYKEQFLHPFHVQALPEGLRRESSHLKSRNGYAYP